MKILKMFGSSVLIVLCVASFARADGFSERKLELENEIRQINIEVQKRSELIQKSQTEIRQLQNMGNEKIGAIREIERMMEINERNETMDNLANNIDGGE